MPKIVHLALKVEDIEAATAFYRKIFGFTVVDEGKFGDRTSRHMSDGTIDLSLIKFKQDSPSASVSGEGPCIHHFGIEVEDLEASSKEVKAAGCEILSKPGEVPIRFLDPSGVVAELVPAGRYKKP